MKNLTFRGGKVGGTPFLNLKPQLLLVYIHKKMFCFKFEQNRTINEEFDYFECGGFPHS